MAEYLSKFRYGEKFDSLPDKIDLDGRGGLRLDGTKVDMIPAGLKGITFIYFTKKPRYIAPDFDGIVVCYSPNHYPNVNDMSKEEIEIAKARYVADREKVEKPRYIEEEDGSLSLCSLPTNIRIFWNRDAYGYCLDLTKTGVSKEQKLGGFKNIILYPKKPVQEEFPFVLAQKVSSLNGRQIQRQKAKTRD